MGRRTAIGIMTGIVASGCAGLSTGPPIANRPIVAPPDGPPAKAPVAAALPATSPATPMPNAPEIPTVPVATPATGASSADRAVKQHATSAVALRENGTGTPGSAVGAPRSSASTPQAPPVSKPAAPVKPVAPPSLDLAALEQRLRDTHAIGLFTKLSIKNQVDSLLADFRAFYGKKSGTGLPQLRQRYELLLLKVLTLLQDSDATLASAIAASRDAIWGVLADPQKFSKLENG